MDVHQVGGGRTTVELSAVGRWAADTRASLEDRIAATMHDGRAYVRPILRALGRGGVVFTACDGTGGGEELGRRVDVDVLGRTFAMPVFPVWLARKSGATLVYLRTWRDDRSVAAFEAPIDASSEEKGVREVARRLSAALRAHPGDWHFWDAWHDGKGGLLR